MKNYTMYSISSTIRIVLTFSVLTFAFDFYFPTILTVILAVLNDGTILTISKDRVQPSPDPDEWRLKEIFILAFVLGLYLTGIGLLLFVIERETFIFQDWFNLRKLSDAELRGLIYLYVSISGQATIFVTRSRRFSYTDRPAYILLAAFVIAQLAATFIGVYGFRGYPNNGVTDFSGCGWGFALLAWVYSLIFFVPMDFIKIAVMKYVFHRPAVHVPVPSFLKADRKTNAQMKAFSRSPSPTTQRKGNTLVAPTPFAAFGHAKSLPASLTYADMSKDKLGSSRQ